jgi:acetyl-CoA synthetase
LKKNVDMALEKSPEVEKVIVFNRTNSGIALNSEKEIWWHEAMPLVPADTYVKPESMDAEDPLLYSTPAAAPASPKGLSTPTAVICFTPP